MKLYFGLTFGFFLTLLGASTLFGQNEPPATEEQFQQQYQERIKKERIGGVYIPKNLDDACQQLTKLSSPESREKLKAVPEDSVMMYMHAKLGKWIIVNWSFYDGSRMSHYLRSAGITYPDDMADFVILAWHRQLNGKSIEIKELVMKFKERRKKIIEKEKAEKLEKGQVIHQEKRPKKN